MPLVCKTSTPSLCGGDFPLFSTKFDPVTLFLQITLAAIMSFIDNDYHCYIDCYF
ncbi:hypothetical protein HMPREF0880_03735 [Yokenella regensburgei ATCC 43003]|nr:hypothetical protein HMPREF0880_03735 [Yokenella regensburgei ATCC 43003]